MKTILFTLEAGSGNGQLNSILKIAARLQGQFNIVLATFGSVSVVLPEYITLETLPKVRFQYEGAYINDIDARYIAQGLTDDTQLARVYSWYTSIAMRYAVDLIVADFSIFAQLFAHIRNIPIISVQSAYALPTVLPSDRKLMAGGRPVDLNDAIAVTTALNRFIKSKNGTVIGDVSDLYKGRTNIVTSYKVFDIFAIVSDRVRDIQYVGTLPATAGTESAWLAGAGPKVLVYADHTKAYLASLITALVLTHNAQVVLVSDTGYVASELSSDVKAKVTVLISPSANIANYLSFADIVLCNGNEKITGEALKAGAAIATIPYNPNQIVIADVVSGNRVGVRVGPQSNFVANLTDLITNLPSYKARATNYAEANLQQLVDPLDSIQSAITLALA